MVRLQKLCMVLVVLAVGTSIVGAETIYNGLIKAEVQGYANTWGELDHVYQAGSANGGLYTPFGNMNDTIDGYQTVMKFPLSGITDHSVFRATISTERYHSATNGPVYMQLLHIIQATSGPVTRADVNTLLAEAVGAPVNTDGAGTKYWDVTSCVNADIAAGFPYSSFRIAAVDASGNMLTTPTTWASICTVAVAADCVPMLVVQTSHIVVTASNQGEANTWGTADLAWQEGPPANGSHFSIFGNETSNAEGYQVVIKFPLVNFAGAHVLNATLSTEQYHNSGSVYMLMRHITQETSGPITRADVVTLPAEVIGVPVLTSGTPTKYWDVTSYINADIDAGFAYTSFRIAAVDAGGNMITTPGLYVSISTAARAPDCAPMITAEIEPRNCDEAIQEGFGFGADLNHDCHVDMWDLNVFCENWLGCTMPGGAGCVFETPMSTGTIVRGTATIDGNISEWNNQFEWVPLKTVIYGTPSDVNNAKMAMRWDAASESIYGAVVVTDTSHVFTDSYGDYWDSGDRIEIYSQGDAAGGTFDIFTGETAQQYFVGHIEAGGTWASVANAYPLRDSGYDDPCFVCASSVVDNNIIYEFRIKQFDNLYAREGAVNPTVVSQLQVGKVVGFDVTIDSRWGINIGDFGVLAPNSNTGRSGNADMFAYYTLVEQTPCGAWGYLAADMNNDCEVDFKDLACFCEDWLKCNLPGVTGCMENWN